MAGTSYGTTPSHERVAADLRRRIFEGEFPPGARIPSRKEISAEYEVGNTAALEAMKVLLAEGLVEGRRGSGTYVRDQGPDIRILRHWRDDLGDRTSTGLAMQEMPGGEPTWTVDSRPAPMTAAVAERLGAAEGDAARRNEYVFRQEGRPLLATVSWEPEDVVGGTPILLPERGPLAGLGVVARMRGIGVEVLRSVEDVTARPALTHEAEVLGVPVGTSLIVVWRTYWSAERPVEASEWLIPGGTNWLRYELPVGETR